MGSSTKPRDSGCTRREGLRRLAFALRPSIDRGLEAHDIAAELLGLAVDWRPARPAAYVTAALARDQQAEAARRISGVARPQPVGLCRISDSTRPDRVAG
ncbi:hypothetical protein ACWEF9_03815 [Streptomyces sp. NPDC004980]